MLTAIQERTVRARSARVVFGTALRRVRGAHGPIALFAPGRVVAYCIHQRRYVSGCIFRTTNGAKSGDRVPGVSPAPHLLSGFIRGRELDRALALLRELARRGIADSLSNEAYLRVTGALGFSDLGVALMVDLMEDSWSC